MARKPKPRPFTPAERQECKRIQLAGFTGGYVDQDRVRYLYTISPSEYSEIGKDVRAEKRAEIRRTGG